MRSDGPRWSLLSTVEGKGWFVFLEDVNRYNHIQKLMS